MTTASVSYEGRDLEAMSFAQNYYRWVAAIFKPYIGKRVGEVGAGSGNFSSLLLNQNIEEFVAIEPSAQMYPSLVEKFKTDARVTTRQGTLGTVCDEYPNYFDMLLYINVLEHIEHEKQDLAHARSMLKDGGYLCIFVPALPFLYSAFDASVGHFRRYTKAPLRKLLQESGFEIVSISYFDIFGIMPWYIFFTILNRNLSSKNTVLYDRLVPVFRSIEKWVPVPIGKNLIVVAKKHTE